MASLNCCQYTNSIHPKDMYLGVHNQQDPYQRRHSEAPPRRLKPPRDACGSGEGGSSRSALFSGDRGFQQRRRLGHQQSHSCGDEQFHTMVLVDTDHPVGRYYSPPSARRLSMRPPTAAERRFGGGMDTLMAGPASMPNSRRCDVLSCLDRLIGNEALLS